MGPIRLLLGACFTLITVACGSDKQTSSYIGGSVSGLSQGSLVLGSTDGQALTVTQNTSFTLPKPIAQGQAYSVFVLSAPTGQSCLVANGAGVVGTRDITDITVSCSLAFGYYTVGGTVTGLSQSQTTGLVLAQGQERLSIAADGAYTFITPLADLAPYAVGIASLPPGQNCQIRGPSGYVDAAHIDDVNIDCKPSTAIALSIAVAGLVQDPNAYADRLTVIDAGAMPAPALVFQSATAQAQSFAKRYSYASPYILTLNAPSGMRCTWDAGARPTDLNTIQGVIVGNTALSVTCVPTTTYALSVLVAGVTSGTLLAGNHQSTDAQNPLAFDVAQTAPQRFSYAYTPQAAYSVAVAAPPGHTCTPTSQSPALTGLMSGPTTISLLCTPTSARLAVGVSGVTRGSVSISNGRSQDANNPLVFTPADPNTSQSFSTVYAAGETATLSLTPNQLACYFTQNGATTLTQSLAGDTFVAVRCAQTIP